MKMEPFEMPVNILLSPRGKRRSSIYNGPNGSYFYMFEQLNESEDASENMFYVVGKKELKGAVNDSDAVKTIKRILDESWFRGF